MTAPDEDRDLASIEAALAEGRATATDPRERELQELALALRADAPQADPAFARRLDERVAGGFAKPRRRRLRLPALRGRWMPALAAGAAVLAAAVVAVSLTGGEEEGPQTAAGPTQEAVPPDAAPQSTTGVAPPGAVTAGRKVERSAQMTIAAAASEIQDVADGIGKAAESHGGFVLSSSFSTGDDSSRGGSFVLRVPSKELEATLAEIGELGDVRSRRESSQDMTGPYRSTANRLGDLLLERSAARDELRNSKPGSDEEEALRARVRRLSAQIADLSGRMDQLRRRTVFSTVSVTLEQDRGAGGAGAGGSGPGDALGDAVGMLEGALELSIRALGVLVPLGLVGLAGWIAAGSLRRRRREAALF